MDRIYVLRQEQEILKGIQQIGKQKLSVQDILDYIANKPDIAKVLKRGGNPFSVVSFVLERNFEYQMQETEKGGYVREYDLSKPKKPEPVYPQNYDIDPDEYAEKVAKRIKSKIDEHIKTKIEEIDEKGDEVIADLESYSDEKKRELDSIADDIIEDIKRKRDDAIDDIEGARDSAIDDIEEAYKDIEKEENE